MIDNLLDDGTSLDFKVRDSDGWQLRWTRPIILGMAGALGGQRRRRRGQRCGQAGQGGAMVAPAACAGEANDTNTLLAAQALLQPLQADVEGEASGVCAAVGRCAAQRCSPTPCAPRDSSSSLLTSQPAARPTCRASTWTRAPRRCALACARETWTRACMRTAPSRTCTST